MTHHPTTAARPLRLRATAAAITAVLAALMAFLACPQPARAASGSSHCAVSVYGAIEDKYLSLHAESGPLGCPTGPETGDSRGGRW
jgi:uncharacterized protein with LGFP repeats